MVVVRDRKEEGREQEGGKERKGGREEGKEGENGKMRVGKEGGWAWKDKRQKRWYQGRR